MHNADNVPTSERLLTAAKSKDRAESMAVGGNSVSATNLTAEREDLE